MRTVIRTGLVAACAMLCAATSDSAAQTPSPRFQPDSFATPGTAKTAPIKPVKSCSRYGDGFVYLPATDTCVKISGSVQIEGGRGR